MSLSKQLKTAADTIEGLSADLEASHKKVAELQQSLNKVASEKAKLEGAVKTASDSNEEKKAQLAQLAKTAAANLKTAGLLSTDKAADHFASVVLDHGQALTQLAKLASVASTAQRTSRVVTDGSTTKVASAHEVFETRLSGIRR